MKKLLALTLTVCLCLGLGVTALAADLPEGWTPADGARTNLPEGWTPADGARDDLPAEEVDVPTPAQYSAFITVDGVELDTTGIPGAPAGYGYIPMRAVTEATDGIVDYYPEDQEAFFFLDNQRIVVHFADLSITLNLEPVEGVTAYLDPAGYTFLPVSFLNGLGDIVVNDNPELDVERYDIITSASDPMNKLASEIKEAVEMGMNTKSTPAEMDEYMGIHQENFTSIVGYFPMMINADTLVIGEVAEGKLDAAKEDLEARKETTMQGFENYLPDQYDIAKNGEIVVAPDGAHIMLIISGNNEKAVELFNAAYPAQ